MFWGISTGCFIVCMGVCVITGFRQFGWKWGQKSYMDAGEQTRDLFLSHGELSFRCADDWPSPPPAPSWRESESYDHNLELGVFRVYRRRETWYLGQRPAGALSEEQRRNLPHFYYGRHGWDFSFTRATFIFLVPVVPGLLIFLRSRLRARHKGFCINCGYDLRATPERCPECGFKPDAGTPLAAIKHAP
jgi:hypothetical protein